jgi:hypothetical protein
MEKLKEQGPSSPRAADAIACSMIALCEIAILASARWGTPIAAMIDVHGVVIIGLSGYLVARLRSASDTGMLAVALVASASTGPIGAIGCAILAWLRLFAVTHGLVLLAGDEAAADIEHPAALAAHIAAGRAMDARAPAPQSLETVLTVGPPAERKLAFYRLSTQYRPPLADALRAALASGSLPIRTPAHGIFAGLLETASTRAAALAYRPVQNAAEADRAIAEAEALLLRSPFDIVASSVCDMVAEDVHALCSRVLRLHPDHRPARLVAGNALMILRRYQEAESLLEDVDHREDAAGLRLECLARLGRFSEFGQLRVRRGSG